MTSVNGTRGRLARWLAAALLGLTGTTAAARGALEVFQPSIVRGASMRPTLVDGERILVECVTHRLGSLSRGAVVVLEPPGASGERYVKRIVGLPGDIVRIGGGAISVNGETCLEGILTGDGERMEIVPEEAYFVVGDNADHSFDSRLFGAVPEARVVGRVVGR